MNGQKEIEQLVCPSGPGNARNSEASVIELKDGRLMLCYSHYYTDGHQDLHPSDIRRRISSDGGKTWTKPEIVQENNACTNLHCVSLLRLNSGGIGLFYSRNGFRGIDREQAKKRGYRLDNEDAYYQAQCVFRISDDEGNTWSPEVIINPFDEDMVLLRNDSALKLTDGRLIAPVTVVASPFGGYEMALCLYSDDDGKTWQNGRTRVAVPGDKAGACEPAVIELKDGRLMMMLRNMTGRLWQSFSSDNGITWTRPEPTQLASSYSPVTIRRIPTTGDLLIIWNQASRAEIDVKFEERPAGFRKIARHRLSCAISTDEGKTWRNFKNIESLDDISYVKPAGIGSLEDVAQFQEHKDYEIMPVIEGKYTNCSYCSALFVDVGKKAVLTYDVGPSPYFSLKLRVLLLEWFYRP